MIMQSISGSSVSGETHGIPRNIVFFGRLSTNDLTGMSRYASRKSAAELPVPQTFNDRRPLLIVSSQLMTLFFILLHPFLIYLRFTWALPEKPLSSASFSQEPPHPRRYYRMQLPYQYGRFLFAVYLPRLLVEPLLPILIHQV